jgi:hypothetical protein
MITLRGDGDYFTDVVGESHYQPWIERVVGGRTGESAEHYTDADLVLEDANPHDPKAVRVDVHGGTVGYLSREDARAYRRWVTATHGRPMGATCPAVIVGGWDRGGGDRGHFGVKLDLPPFTATNVELVERAPRRSSRGQAEPRRPRGPRRTPPARTGSGVWAGVAIGFAVAATLGMAGCCGLYLIGSAAKPTSPATVAPTR